MLGQMVALTGLSLSPTKEHRPLKVKADRAAWGVGGKGFYDDKCKFWFNGQALYFDGEPNMDLYPLNKLAYDKMQMFLDKLDELGEKKAKKEGRAYIRQPRTEWREDGDYDEIPQPQSVLGVKIESSNEAIR